VAVGQVWLVGAGPGDPDLITVRGRDLLAAADVVVTDRLVSAALRDRIPPGVEIVDVGKRPGRPSTSQDEINALLVERARLGAVVVRLKGGDPFVLGRGGEEARACAAAGIRCTVVPGVTSALAAPAYAGIPVTDRELSQDVAIVSGHLAPGHPDSTVDWAALGGSRMTVVILMGTARLAEIAAALIAGGRHPDTPAAVIERATTPAQRVVRGRLETIAVDALAARLRSPAVTVVGAVAARADGVPDLPAPPHPRPDGGPNGAEPNGVAVSGVEPNGVAVGGVGAGAASAEPSALFGARVLVPRTRARAGLLAARLRALGADPVETVVSRLGPVDDPAPLLAALAGADALALAGAEEVDALVDLLRRAGRDVRALAGLELIAADPAAAAAFAARGLSAREPARESAGGPAGGPAGAMVVVAASGSPTAVTVRRPVTVRRVRLVQDVRAEADPVLAAALAAGELAAVAFASSTAVGAFAALYGPPPGRTRIAAVGARTADACAAAGFPPDAVATEPGIYPLADAVARALAERRPAERGLAERRPAERGPTKWGPAGSGSR
jgi:uroporphyrinogen III methyltransferase / synthase